MPHRSRIRREGCGVGASPGARTAAGGGAGHARVGAPSGAGSRTHLTGRRPPASSPVYGRRPHTLPTVSVEALRERVAARPTGHKRRPTGPINGRSQPTMSATHSVSSAPRSPPPTTAPSSVTSTGRTAQAAEAATAAGPTVGRIHSDRHPGRPEPHQSPTGSREPIAPPVKTSGARSPTPPSPPRRTRAERSPKTSPTA